MPRFIGFKNNYISIVSDKPFECDGLEILQVPLELESLSTSDLILNCKIVNGVIKFKKQKRLAKDLKLALVGNWKMRCGIASYSENLWPEVVKHVGSFKLFIEENDLWTDDIHNMGNLKLSDNDISICWKRGTSSKKLIEELKEYDPDIIWIQHEFGLWPNATQWLSMMHQLSDFRVIVTQHSVFHHQDKTICEAAIPEIVTHLNGGYNVLVNEKQVPGKVYVIPHGCFLPVKERLWNFYKSERTFLQFGFGFRYKGWENSIKAVAILKDKYPDVFFTGLFSESPYNKVEHQIYYNELMILIEELGIKENIAIIRGYQSDVTLDSFLKTNKATVFPYVSHPSHEVFGASGAARLAMSRCLPVITSSVNHFSDLNTIKADTPEEIANQLDLIFSNHKARENQINIQNEYLENNSWEKIGLMYIDLFTK